MKCFKKYNDRILIVSYSNHSSGSGVLATASEGRTKMGKGENNISDIFYRFHFNY